MELKHLVIEEAGFTKLTGNAGGLDFENGRSVSPVSKEQAARLCAAMRCYFEDGTGAGAANDIVENANTPMPVVEKMPVSKEKTGVEKYLETQAQKPQEESVVVEGVKYTRRKLEGIADKEGIAGLRTIAEPLNVKFKSVTDLIGGILRAQK